MDRKEMKWERNNTMMLIDSYEKHHDKVGTLAVKNKKQMWHIIAEELTVLLKAPVMPHNCENRWKVLERNYKKYIGSKNATGRGRTFFEYSHEMDKVLGAKKSIELVLTTDAQHKPVGGEEAESQEPGIRISAVKQKQNASILQAIRDDRKAYQEKRLKIELEKLEVLKARNELIKERNEILRENKDLPPSDAATAVKWIPK